MKTRISEKARSLGFDAVGFTLPVMSAKAQIGLQEFIEAGAQGDMAWMNNEKRADPKAVWPEAKSVIVVGHNYGPASNPMAKLAEKNIGNISVYARGSDYHDVIKKKLRELAGWIAQEYSCEVKIFVDTAPVMEKPLAEAAGIGWQGKHTCLVSREYGSWLFLGSVFTTLQIEPDAPEEFHCGSCTKCIDICPTQAITSCGKLDVPRCIAYLTNEHKGQIPLEFRKAIGNRIYGCDDCLAVCPWNKFAQTTKESAYHAREELKSPPLSELLKLDDAAFRQFFSKSPIKRIGRDRFIRNVLVAAGNSCDKALINEINPLILDNNPIVAEMAAWAAKELLS